MLLKFSRGAAAAADYANVRDGTGGGNDLDEIAAALGTGGPLIMGGRRPGDFARAWHIRGGFAQHARMSGTASASSRAAAIAASWTIMGWVNPNNFRLGFGYLIALSGTSGAVQAENILLGIHLNGTGNFNVRFEIGAGVDTVFTFAVPITTGSYQHWTITKSPDGGGGTNYELFIDGVSVEVINQAISTSPDGGGNSRWHMGQQNHNAITGALSSSRQQDVAFFNAELSPGDIAGFATLATDFDDTHPDLEAWWPCDEAPDVIDSGDDGQHMRLLNNAQQIPTSIVIDPLEGSLRLEGDDGSAGQIVARPTEFMRNVLGDLTGLTFFLWMQFPPRNYGASTRKIFRYGGNADAANGSDNILFTLEITGSYELSLFHEHGAGANEAFVSLPVVAGVDRFSRKLITVRRNDLGGGNVSYQIFIDGQDFETSGSLQGPDSGTSGVDQNDQNLFELFGDFYGAQFDLYGIIGSCALYTSALTDEEIEAIFILGDTGSAPAAPAPTPVAFPLNTENGGAGFRLRTATPRNT